MWAKTKPLRNSQPAQMGEQQPWWAYRISLSNSPDFFVQKNPVQHGKIPGELTGFPPQICRIYSSGKIRFKPGKFWSLGPYDITIGSGPSASFGCYSWWTCPWPRSEANLNNASFQWVCNLATHCSVFVRVEGRIQSIVINDDNNNSIASLSRRNC